MLKRVLILFSLLLTGCSYEQYKGHYKVDLNIIQRGMTKQEVIEKFGCPIVFADDDVFYYCYYKVKKSSFGIDKIINAKIIRLKFRNNELIKIDEQDFEKFSPDKEKTTPPNTELNIMFETIESIGGIVGIEESNRKLQDNKS